MKRKKDLREKTPGEERREIGTPAGESPEEGRKRHGTQEKGRKGGSNVPMPHHGLEPEETRISQGATQDTTDLLQIETEEETGGYTESGVAEVEAKSDELHRRKG